MPTIKKMREVCEEAIRGGHQYGDENLATANFLKMANPDRVLKLLDAVATAKTLAANTGGLRIEEQGIRALVGNTNWWCVEHCCEEVNKALAALEQDDV